MTDRRISDTKKWLDQRYSRKVDGEYYAHQPIYGYDSSLSEPNAILRIARTYHLLKLIHGLQFTSFLDVGGGEGYISGLIKRVHTVDPVSSDLSSEACQRARELFGVYSVSSDSARLPFFDHSFDLVLCSEVIEHLPEPVLAISELVRIARKYVLITTSEFCSLGEYERAARLCLLDYDYPHAEKNWFTKGDFSALLGENLLFHSQMDNLLGHNVEYFAQAKLTRLQIEKALEVMTRTTALDSLHDGVIVLDIRDPQLNSNEIHRMYSSFPIDNEYFDLLLNPASISEYSLRDAEKPLADLVSKLMCLACGGECVLDGAQIVCKACHHKYNIENGVPLMLVDPSLPRMIMHTEQGVVQLLSLGDPDKAAQVKKTMARLHSPRPVCTTPRQRAFARVFLRAYWFIMRTESFSDRAMRVLAKIRRKNNKDYSKIEARLFSE